MVDLKGWVKSNVFELVREYHHHLAGLIIQDKGTMDGFERLLVETR